MKKIILVAIAALSLGLSANAFAAAHAFSQKTVVQSGTTASTQCTILSQDVTLNVSKDVTGAWGCEGAANLSFGAACHLGGSTNTRSVTCGCDATGTASPAACSGGCTDTPVGSGNWVYGGVAGEAVDVTGRVAFGGGSNGGSIKAIALSGAGGAAKCDATTIIGISLFSTVD